MQVVITGATGLVGRAVTARLLRDGHRVVAWTRDPARAGSRLGAEVELLDARGGQAALNAAVAASDGVVNLAGASLLGRGFAPRNRRALRESRVETTRRVVEALGAAPKGERVLVSASAVFIYGNRGDAAVTEAEAPGDGPVAQVMRAWEDAAVAAEAAGVRTVRLRLGLVLGTDGGVIGRLAPWFRAGLGGRLGRGTQAVSWIHLHDLAEIVVRCLTDRRLRGPVNAVAPESVDGRTFTQALARALDRPAWVPVPGLLQRLALGDATRAITTGQRAFPGVLTALGFEFRYPALEGALAALFDPAKIPAIRPVGAAGAPVALAQAGSRPTYRLEATCEVPASAETVFAFLSAPENLGLLTPADMDLRIEAPAGPVRVGTTIRYHLRVGPLRLGWKAAIRVWEPGRRFADEQVSGPYRTWLHEHRVHPRAGGSLMADRVWYALPLGPLGRLVHRLFVARALRRLFAYRVDALALRFGARPPGARRAA